MKENEEGARKILVTFKYVAIVLVALNFYWYIIRPYTDVNKYLDNSVDVLGNALHLFVIPHMTIIWAFLFMVLSSWGDKAKKREEMKLFGRKIKPTKDLGWKTTVISSSIWLLCPTLLLCHSAIVVIPYILILFGSYLGFIFGCAIITSVVDDDLNREDPFNKLEESAFPQNETLVETDDSINLPTKYKYMGKTRNGWINVINPFRATMVLGTPGSGKSFAIINPYIRQQLSKGYTMYCYDFKFPTLSEIVYNNFCWNKEEYLKRYGRMPKFCVINFDDPRRSHRANPIKAEFITDVTDANEISQTILYNINRTWVSKQGDFFNESAINFLTASIWYLRCVEGGKYCTFPHVIEFVNQPIENTIPLMASNEDLVNYMAPFFNAWASGATEQIQGQIGSVQIPLSRFTSKLLYWTMSGDDFNMDINNPEDPKVLCVGNNPLKQSIYGTALGLYNGRIVRLVNQQHKLKCSLIVDELPTIFFMGLSELIATARSNKIAVMLGFQDFAQLVADYKKESADKIIKTVGNLFCGNVVDDTAKSISARFGKNKQHKKSISISDNGVSTSISEQNDMMVPESAIAQLSQGCFVGIAADDFGKENDKKVFQCQIQVDMQEVKEEEKNMRPMPIIYSFDDKIVDKKLREWYNHQADRKEDISKIKETKALVSFLKEFAKDNKEKAKEIQKIRDDRMDEILLANQRKIAQDIIEMMDRQLEWIEQEAQSNPRLKKISDRRHQAMQEGDEQ